MKDIFKIFVLIFLISFTSCSNENDTPQFPLEQSTIINPEDYIVYETLIQSLVKSIVLQQHTDFFTSTTSNLEQYIPLLLENNSGFETDMISKLITANQNYSVINHNFNTYFATVELISAAQLKYLFPTNEYYYNSFGFTQFNKTFPNILRVTCFSKIAYNSAQTKAIVQATNIGGFPAISSQ